MYLGTLGLLSTVIGNDFLSLVKRYITLTPRNRFKNQYKVGCTISAIIQYTKWRVDPRELPKGVLFPPLDRKYKRFNDRKSSSKNDQEDGLGEKSAAFEMNEDCENKYMAAL